MDIDYGLNQLNKLNQDTADETSTVRISAAFSSIFSVDMAKGTYRSILRHPVYCGYLEDRGQWDDLVKQYSERAVHDEDREFFRSAMSFENIRDRVSAEENLYFIEYRRNDIGADISWCRATVIPNDLDERGHAKHFLLTMADITAEKNRGRMAEAMKTMTDDYARELYFFRSGKDPDIISRLHVALTRDRVLEIINADYGVEVGATYEKMMQSSFFRTATLENGESIATAFNREVLLARFDKTDRHFDIDYRRPGTEPWAWRRVEVLLLQNPDDMGIEAFMYSTDISREKMQSLMAGCLISTVYEVMAIIDINGRTYMRQRMSGSMETVDEDYFEHIRNVLEVRSPINERENVEQQLSHERVLSELSSHNTYTVTNEELQPDGASRHKMRQYSWLDDTHSMLLVCRMDVTASVMEEQQNEELRHLHSAFVEGLNRVHDAELLVDLDKMKFYVFKLSKTFRPDREGDYDELRSMFVDSFSEDSPYHERFDMVCRPENMRELLKDGGMYETDYRRDLPDGTYKWFRYHMSAVMLQEGGHIRYVMITTTDVTTVMETELRLQEELRETNKSLEREMSMLRSFRNIYSQALYVDVATNRVEVIEAPEEYNSLMRQMDYDMTKSAEFVAREIMEESYHGRIMRFMDISDIDARFADINIDVDECLGRDGRWYRAYMIPVDRDETGHITSLIFAVQDIDMEKRREEALHRRIESDSAIIQKSSLDAYDFIAVLDTESERICLRGGSWYNREVPTPEDKYEMPYDYFVSVAAEKFATDGESAKQILEKLAMDSITESIDKHGVHYVLLSFRGASDRNSTKYKQFRFTWLDDTRMRILITRSDVTVAMEKEKSVNAHMQEALTAAEAANAAKSEFLSRMSHDIRTPMNAIIGFSTLLLGNADNPEKVTNQAKKILYSSNHLLGLINDVLDMSKIESGKIQLSTHEFSLSECITMVDSIMRPQMEKRSQSFEVTVADIDSDSFEADSQRLQQILINVLGNATKYTQEGGHISLRIRSLGMISEKYENISFEIEDNGRGMTEEYQKVIFEPFSREQLESQETAQGTGLGMAITKNLVNMMGGTINVVSRLGEGSKFTIVIPMQLADGDSEKGELRGDSFSGEYKSGGTIAVDNPLTGLRILAAEDNDLNAEILREILKVNGAEVTIMPNGKAVAAEFLRSRTGEYALILMDIRMPVMDGYEATRTIRGYAGGGEDISDDKAREAGSIPIIAMTANAFSEDVQNCLAAGMNAHVPKPLDIEVLKNAVRELVHQ